MAEKPQAARKIETVTNIRTISLVGHLLELKKQTHHWSPPYFNIAWTPKKGMKEKLNNIKQNLCDTNNILIATDYDMEGQLIALNILRYSNIKFTEVNRMKFSSLESEEILKSYKNPIKFDINLALQAETRHYLDWYFGMNISKVLTILRPAKQFKLTPTGRVKSPTLSWLVEREKEILSFTPKTVWYTDVYGVYGEEQNKTFEIGRFSFEDLEHAQTFINQTPYGKVDHVDEATYKLKQYPPNTDWMMRYGLSIGLSVDVVGKILQSLYLNEYCSYPRTNSQQYLSHGVDTQRYLKRLVGVIDDADKALGNQPLEGEKEDVHPAIYPIRVYPEEDLHSLLWKEIVQCFVKCHLPPVTETYKTLYVDIDGEVTPSREFPEDLNTTEEFELTYNLKKGQLSPPARYTQGKVYDWMTKGDVGTKDTRTLIIPALLEIYAYETEKGIFVNSLGMKVTKVLSKFCPELISINLTRTFENNITEIGQSKSMNDVLNEGKKVVIKLVETLLDNKTEISKLL